MTAIGILILHAVATWFMTGVIWFVQVVHYPLMSGVGGEGYAAYQRRHMSRTTWIVALPMFIELVTALAMIWFRPTAVPMWAVWAGLGGIAIVWASTALVQVPQHERLIGGFDPHTHRRLVYCNAIRTAAWSVRAALVTYVLWLAATSSS